VNMVVKTQHHGLRISGLYVGIGNVRRYFSKRIPVVDLQLDHLRIQCGLTPHFWNGQPEIRDPRLCDWLEAKLTHACLHHRSMMVSLIPSGKNSFKLACVDVEDTEKVHKHGRWESGAGDPGKPPLAGKAVVGDVMVAGVA
jgi:hypothetical protein